MPKEVKMKDIAEKLGISIVAVSKALSGKAGVSNELRMRIRKTADEMGYHYNTISKRKAERSNNIGIIVAERYVQEDSFYFKFFRHISQLLQVSEHYAFFRPFPNQLKRIQLSPKSFFSSVLTG